MTPIRHIPHADIDKIKWDARVAASANGFIFSQTFYLDAVCHWDALVQGDYEYVIALPVKKKAGFSYIYTPYFTGQMGIIGPTPLTAELCTFFIRAIPAGYALIDTFLNEYNSLLPGKEIQVAERTNMVLSLEDRYENIYQLYSKDAKKNLRRTTEFNLYIGEPVLPEKVIAMYREAYHKLNRKISRQDYDKLHRLAQTALTTGKGFTVGIYSPGAGLVASAFFGIDNKRIYYIVGAPNAAGRTMKAIHFLVDAVIKKYAGGNLVFDFEGSDIKSVAIFYRKFNPQVKQYLHARVNRLPLLLRWLKR